MLYELAPVFRTPRKGDILQLEVFEWEHDDVGSTDNTNWMRSG